MSHTRYIAREFFPGAAMIDVTALATYFAVMSITPFRKVFNLTMSILLVLTAIHGLRD
jgi:hypothetical protein